MNKTKEKIKKLYRLLAKQNIRVNNLQETKDKGYLERNMLVATLSKLYPAYLAKHDINDKDWDTSWLNIVYIEIPTGQVSWHFHDSQLHLFSHLSYKNNNWDGHTTDEKYERLLSLIK